MWVLVLFLSAACLADNPEKDSEESRKVLGSSVVTSISVIMDNGNGSKVYTDAVGNPVSKPLTASDLASPIDLLNPDRYEFYTFDDNGELVKRLMTLDEIQDIIATGDGDGLSLDSLASGFLPEKRVNDVVNNVQSVLKTEMENHKDDTSPPIFDTPDVSDSWSMILPAIFGNSGEDIKPEKPVAHVTPDTIMIEPTYSSNTRKPTTTSKSTTSTRTTPQQASTTKTSKVTTSKPSSTSTTVKSVETTSKFSSTTSETPTTEEKTVSAETTTSGVNQTETIEYVEIKPLLDDTENLKNNLPPSTSTRKPETTIPPIRNATLISISSTAHNVPTTTLSPSSTDTVTSKSSSQVPPSSPMTISSTSTSRIPPATSTTRKPWTTTTTETLALRTEPSTSTPSKGPLNQLDSQVSESIVVPNNYTEFTTLADEKLITTTDFVTEREQTTTEAIIKNELKLPTTDILEQLLLTSTKISEINSELSERPGSSYFNTKFETTTDLLTTNSLDEKTTTESLTTTDQNLVASIEQLISQAITNVENPIPNLDSGKVVQGVIVSSGNKTMSEIQDGAGTIASNLMEVQTTVQTSILNDIESDSTVLDSVGSLLSQVIESGSGIVTTDVPTTTILYTTPDVGTEILRENSTDAFELRSTEIPIPNPPTEVSRFETTEELKLSTTEELEIISTVVPELTSTEIRKSNSTQALTSSTTDGLQSSSIEALTSSSTEGPKSTTVETLKTSSTEALKSSSSETLKPSTTEALTTSFTEALKSSTTEALKISSTERLKASTAEAPETSSTAGLKSSTAEAPETSSTEGLKSSTSEALETSSTERLKSSTAEALKTSSTEAAQTSSTEALKSSSTETYKPSSSETIASSTTESLKSSSKLSTTTLITEATTKPFVPHLINITIINRNQSKPAKADLSLELEYENELKRNNVSLLEQNSEPSSINLSTTGLNNKKANVEEVSETTTATKVEVTTIKPKHPPKPSIVINIRENSSSIAVDQSDPVPEQDKTESLWTPVSTLAPHAELTRTTETSPHVLPSRIEEIVEPPAPIDLVPKPLQGFGLEESTSNLDPDIYNFVQLCNELSFDFWRSVTTGISTARSLVVSPFAATSLLAMVFLGARGATSGEMNEILKLDDMVTFNPHLIFRNISESIRVSHESGVATSAIIRELFSDRSKGKLLSFYKERVKQFYDGHAEEVSFKEINDIIRRRTNLLVRKNTGGKIQEYLKDSSIFMRPPLAGFSVSIFQTDCSHASSLGHDGELHFVVLPSIRQRRLIPIPAAVWRSNFLAGYEPSLDATAVALGNKDQTISTIFVIPGQQGVSAPGDSLTRLEKRLVESAFKKGAWARLLRSLIPRPGLELQIPRFSHKSVINASTSLQRMGLKDLFDARKADLRGLNGVAHELHLSDMLQVNNFATCGETRIGEAHHTEIYPATAERPFRKSRNLDNYEGNNYYYIGDEPRDYQRAFHDPLHDPNFLSLPLAQRPRQARLPEPPRLRFDRPFLFFVRHNPTGAILHMGRFHPRLLP